VFSPEKICVPAPSLITVVVPLVLEITPLKVPEPPFTPIRSVRSKSPHVFLIKPAPLTASTETGWPSRTSKIAPSATFSDARLFVQFWPCHPPFWSVPPWMSISPPVMAILTT
jgi:hypothetical protein